MINRVVLLGHIGEEPDIRCMANGATYAVLKIMLTENWVQAGVRRRTRRPVFVKVWDERYVEIIQRQPRKGELVYLEGRLSSSRYVDRDGVARTQHEVSIPAGRAGLIRFINAPSNEDSPDSPDRADSSDSGRTVTIGAETLARLRAGEAVEMSGVGLVAADDLLQGQ